MGKGSIATRLPAKQLAEGRNQRGGKGSVMVSHGVKDMYKKKKVPATCKGKRRALGTTRYGKK